MAARTSDVEHPAALAGRLMHGSGEGIVYGPGSVHSSLPSLLARSGVRRPFVVSTASVTRAGLTEQLRELLGGEVAGVFDGSKEHTPEPVVLEAASQAADTDADGIISLGGSSVVDLAKGVAMVLAEGDDLARLRGHFRADEGGARQRIRMERPKLAHISVPTTLSGAEFTGGVGITDPLSGAKNIYLDAKLAPRWVILDPEWTRATPAPLWAATGMKALADTLEVLCSRRANPLSDAVAAKGLRLLLEELGPATADADNVVARGRCQFAVGMVLPQLATVGVGLVAGLRHQLGGALGVGHGVASTIVLPEVLRWNRPACETSLHEAATAAGFGSIEELIGRIETLRAELGLPGRLRDVGVTRDQLPGVADHVLGDVALATNPRPVTTTADVMAVLDAAW
ncbi:MAG: iron-containing alcohol dehydrogenase [Acidimicrobiales bacterium]